MPCLNQPREAVTLTASLVREDAPERLWNPSECFTQLFFKAQRRPLTQATLTNLQRATARWLKDSRQLTQKAEPPRAEVQQTLVASRRVAIP